MSELPLRLEQLGREVEGAVDQVAHGLHRQFAQASIEQERDEVGVLPRLSRSDLKRQSGPAATTLREHVEGPNYPPVICTSELPPDGGLSDRRHGPVASTSWPLAISSCASVMSPSREEIRFLAVRSGPLAASRNPPNPQSTRDFPARRQMPERRNSNPDTRISFSRAGVGLRVQGYASHASPIRRGGGQYPGTTMTAKEKLRAAVDELSEADAADILDYLAHRDPGSDGLSELLRNAPVDDEPVTPEEEEGVAEARAEIARGEIISAEEIRREFA